MSGPQKMEIHSSHAPPGPIGDEYNMKDSNPLKTLIRTLIRPQKGLAEG